MLSTIQRPACRSVFQCSRLLSTTPRRRDVQGALDIARQTLKDDFVRTLRPQSVQGATAAAPTATASATALNAAPAQQIVTDSTVFEVPPEKDPILQFLATRVMKHGRYPRAQKMISDMLLHIHTLTRSPPLPIVHQAVLKASPAVRIKSTKVGARAIVRPVALSERQRTSQGIRWIIAASNNKPGLERSKRLAKEMIAVIRGDSSALEEKARMHRAAMISRGSLTKR